MPYTVSKLSLLLNKSKIDITRHLRPFQTYVMLCAIWYRLWNLKNVKNTHGGVSLLVSWSSSIRVIQVFKIVQMVQIRATHYYMVELIFRVLYSP